MEKENNYRKCGAKTRSGQPCRRRSVPQNGWWVKGNFRCHLHGGKSLAGFAHPNFKHGRYSKVLNSLYTPGMEEGEEEIKAERKRRRGIRKTVREFVKKHKRNPDFDEFSRIVNESREPKQK